MNILTFDIEDWYNCDFISHDYDWDKYEVRIYEGVNRILEALESHQVKGTFFCLGWLAENHPEVIRSIHKAGHQVGAHSYQHCLATEQDKKTFYADTERTKKGLEDVIGAEVNAYRAPGFSVTQNNLWVLDQIYELGFRYDCSIFPAAHDYGGFPDFGHSAPSLLSLANGGVLKEFPINFAQVAGKNLVFSGGGFFRLFPYFLIKKWSKEADYLMSYFHPRDFDPGQPVMEDLPRLRKFKSYVGLKTSYNKLLKYLNDFEFVNLLEADALVNWEDAKSIDISRLIP